MKKYSQKTSHGIALLKSIWIQLIKLYEMSLRSHKSLLLSTQPCQMLKNSLDQDSQLRLLSKRKMCSSSQPGVEIKIGSMKSIIMLIQIMVYIINSYTVAKDPKMIKTSKKMQMIMKSTYCLETHLGKILMIFKDKKKSLRETSSVLRKVKRKRQRQIKKLCQVNQIIVQLMTQVHN